jgi:hypothetical protein
MRFAYGPTAACRPGGNYRTKVQAEYRPSIDAPAVRKLHYQRRNIGTVREPPAIETVGRDVNI